MTNQPENSDASRTSMASTKADLRELKANSGATVQELQEFLRQLKGKSPQEMLGVVASSQLFRATILSVILVTIALFAFTAVPYFLADEPATIANSTASDEPATAPSTPEAQPKPAQEKSPKPLEPSDPLDPLDVNSKLTAPPNSNPLEDDNANFLKDLE